MKEYRYLRCLQGFLYGNIVHHLPPPFNLPILLCDFGGTRRREPAAASAHSTAAISFAQQRFLRTRGAVEADSLNGRIRSLQEAADEAEKRQRRFEGLVRHDLHELRAELHEVLEHLRPGSGRPPSPEGGSPGQSKPPSADGAAQRVRRKSIAHRSTEIEQLKLGPAGDGYSKLSA